MNRAKPKILFIAMSDSIHTAKWTGQVCDLGWELHLFPSIDLGLAVYPLLRNIIIYHSFYGRQKGYDQNVRFRGVFVFLEPIAYLARRILLGIVPSYRSIELAILIKWLKPDIIHAIEIQSAGYLTLEAKKILGDKLPPLIVTNFGSDIYLFGKLVSHKAKIREVMESADYYKCESLRDISLGKDLGFQGKVWPVYPNAGGFNLHRLERFKQQGPTSTRKFILLKGYQSWAGRALVGIRSLERCADLLKGYTIVIYSANKDVIIASEIFTAKTEIPTIIIPKNTPNDKILWYQGHARIYLGLSISDGVSTSFLESLAMGSFPIQSWTSTADEWIEDGKTGILVPPEDPEIIEKALRRALKDNKLVDLAAILNWKTTQKRLDSRKIKKQTVEMYKQILDNES